MEIRNDEAAQLFSLFSGRFQAVLNNVETEAVLGVTYTLPEIEAVLLSLWEAEEELKEAAIICWNNILLSAKHRLSPARWEMLAGHLAKKRVDYGAFNVIVFQAKGIVVRTFDKCARIRNMEKRAGYTAVGESIEDAWMDIAGYAAVALLVLTDRWVE